MAHTTNLQRTNLTGSGLTGIIAGLAVVLGRVLELLDATAETARPPAAALPRVTVTFRASDYDFAYVRLRGRSYALEPSAKVRLPAGRQRVYMRESADAPWRDLGELTLRAGQRYDARLRRPGRVDLQAR